MSTEQASSHAQTSSSLAPWLAKQLGVEHVDITDLHRHAEGFSWETYTFFAHWRDPETSEARHQGLAVRREPEDGVLAPYDIRLQYALHQAVLESTDIPMPELFWLELDTSILGMPFYVMERLDGEVPVPDEPQPFSEDQREAIGDQFVACLGELHTLDWSSTGLSDLLAVPADPEEAARQQLEHWTTFYEDSVLLEVPVVRAALNWLHGNIATSDRLALCHGDFRNGNFMVRDGRIVGIFDWELAHVSDPLDDLGWTTLPAFQGMSGRVNHLLDLEDFLARYEQRTGIHVDRAALRFWNVLSYVKTIAIFFRGCRAFEDGRAGDLRLAGMGHRSLYLQRQMGKTFDLGL